MLNFKKYRYGSNPTIHNIANIKIQHEITVNDLRTIVVSMINMNIHLCSDNRHDQFDNLHKLRHLFTKQSIEDDLRSTLYASGRNRLDFGGWDAETSDDEDAKGTLFVNTVIHEVFGLR